MRMLPVIAAERRRGMALPGKQITAYWIIGPGVADRDGLWHLRARDPDGVGGHEGGLRGVKLFVAASDGKCLQRGIDLTGSRLVPSY